MILPEWEFHKSKPLGYRLEDEALLETERVEVLPALDVLEIKDVTVLEDGAVFRGMHLIRASLRVPEMRAAYGPRRRVSIGLYPAISVPTGKPVLNLSDHWSHEYYHWFFDALPRLMLAWRKGLEPHLLLSVRHQRPFILNSLERLGVALEDITFMPYHSRASLDSLWLPPFPGPPDFHRPELLRDIRQRLGLRHEHPGRRIYLSRAKARFRKVVNEEALMRALGALGFETLFAEDLTAQEQIAAFSDCEALISNHGAGLSNLLFMPQGATVIELRKDRYGLQEDGSREPARYYNIYYHASQQLGMRYGMLACPSPDPDESCRTADIEVGMGALASLLGWMGLRRACLAASPALCGHPHLSEPFNYRKRLPIGWEPEHEPLFETQGGVSIPGLAIDSLKNVVLHEDGSVFQGRMLMPCSLRTPDMRPVYSPLRRLKNLFRPRVPISTSLPVVSILDHWSHEYFHWFFDALPRLMLARREFGRFHLVLARRYQRPYILHCLQALGVNEVSFLERKTCVRLPLLHLPSFNGPHNYHRPEMLKEIRKAFIPAGAKGTRRLYISRAKARYRKVLNEEALWQLLEQHGFERVIAEELSPGEQIALFNQASVILGLHGAGFTNLLFMPRPGLVVELRKDCLGNRDREGRPTVELPRRSLSFYHACDVLDMPYAYLACPSPTPELHSHYADIEVDLERLKSLLGQLSLEGL